jgi:hypothetical protein
MHLAFIIFTVFGGILTVIWPKAVWVHIPCAIWGVIIEVAGWICPLTYLENGLRARAGQVPYAGDFVIHFIEPIIYPEGLTRELQLILGAIVVIVNGVVYGYLILRYKRRKQKIINS